MPYQFFGRARIYQRKGGGRCRDEKGRFKKCPKVEIWKGPVIRIRYEGSHSLEIEYKETEDLLSLPVKIGRDIELVIDKLEDEVEKYGRFLAKLERRRTDHAKFYFSCVRVKEVDDEGEEVEKEYCKLLRSPSEAHFEDGEIYEVEMRANPPQILVEGESVQQYCEAREDMELLIAAIDVGVIHIFKDGRLYWRSGISGWQVDKLIEHLHNIGEVAFGLMRNIPEEYIQNLAWIYRESQRIYTKLLAYRIILGKFITRS